MEAELGTRLGLEAQDLEFFRLEPLPAAEIGSLGAETAVGVRVLGGTFNLEALEATLADNRRLREEEAAGAQTLRALKQHVELQNDVVREQNVTMAEVRQDGSAAQRGAAGGSRRKGRKRWDSWSNLFQFRIDRR